MNFQESVTIPASTPIEVPLRVSVRLTAGMVTSIHPLVPSGCYGLTGVRILRGSFQLWPMTEGEWFVADQFTDSFPLEFPLTSEPYELIIEGYNLDDTYDHTISFRIGVSRQGDPGLALLDVIKNKVPDDLQELVVSAVDSKGHTRRLVSLVDNELLPILKASLKAQQDLLTVSYQTMSMRELLNF